MKSQQLTNAFIKETFMDLKTQLETVAKNHQTSIQNLETKFDRLADKQSSRPSGSLPSNTQPNPKGHNSKAYQPPQSRNEHVNVVFTKSGKSYDLPVYPDNQQNDFENPINFNSDDEDEEPTPQPKIQNPKPVKETLLEKISEDEARNLEKVLDEKEVWDAISGCGADKAPRPDGFNFKFIKKFWEVIKSDLMRVVMWFGEKTALRRLGSIFTSVYAADQKLKKAYKVYKAGKRLLYVKRNKAISLGKGTSKVGIELQQLFLKNCTYKALMNELVNDGIKLSKLKINSGFINGLPKKWLSFCQSLRNTNHVKDSELASLFGKLKYEENLIDTIYETKKNKSLVSAIPLSTAFFSTSIVQDFQDSPDDEEDTRSSHEYLNDLEEEYQARDLLAKSKSSSQHKPELRPIKDFKAKYNKIKAKLALLSSSASASNSSSGKNKGLIVETYEWDKEEVSSNENEAIKFKALMCISEQIPTQKKKILGINQLTEDTSSFGPKDLVFIKSSTDNSNVSITSSKKPRLSKAKDYTLPNHNTGKVPSNESQRNTTDPSVVVSDSLAIDYDLEDESLVCSTPLPPLEKLAGAKPVFRPKTIKSILKSNSTFKAKTLKGIALKEPSSALAKDNKKCTSTLKTFSAPTGKLKNVKIEDDPPLATVMKELNELKLQLSKNKSSYSRNHQSQQVPHNSLQNRYNIQFKISCKLYGQNNHLSENCFHVLFCKKCKRTDHRTCDHAEFMSSIKTT
ncbi:hypothetical protein Tco_0252671 [Tanacetum coccineum]